MTWLADVGYNTIIAPLAVAVTCFSIHPFIERARSVCVVATMANANLIRAGLFSPTIPVWRPLLNNIQSNNSSKPEVLKPNTIFFITFHIPVLLCKVCARRVASYFKLEPAPQCYHYSRLEKERKFTEEERGG